MPEIISNEPFVFNAEAEELKPLDALTISSQPDIEEEIEKQNLEDEAIENEEEVAPIIEEAEFDIFGDREPVDQKEVQEEEEEQETEEGTEGIEEGEEESEDEEDIDLNIYEFMAKQLKVDGELPEDFEITDKTTPNEIYEAYVNSIKKDAEEEIRNNVFQELRENGINEGDLQYARLLRQGVDPIMLHEASRYEHLSNIDIEKADESEKKSIVEKMYKEKNLSDKAIKKLIDAAELDDDLDPMAEEAKVFFKSKRDIIVEQQEKSASIAKAQQEEIDNRNQQIISGVLKKSQVLGEDISDVKDFKRSLYDRDQSVEINGQQMVATEYQLFDLAYKNDPEVKLWAFKKWKYRDTDQQDTETKAQAKAEKELLKGYKTAVEMSKKKMNKAKLKKELSRKPLKDTKKSRFGGPKVFNS